MDDFLKNIKNKLTVDNVFSKDKPKEPVMNKDEDIRRTLGNVDNNDIIDADDIAARLNEIQEQSKIALDDLKVQSNSVIDSAKKQSSSIIDSAKSGFGVLNKTSSPPDPKIANAPHEEEYPFTTDGKSEVRAIDAAEVITKLDEVQQQSWSALDELMSQSNKIIDAAKFQSNQIIESALTNLNVLQKASNQNVIPDNVYDPDDNLLNLF